MVWSSPTVQIAAEELVRRASSRSWEREGRLKDDVTCVVVDLNPSQRTYEPVLATVAAEQEPKAPAALSAEHTAVL